MVNLIIKAKDTPRLTIVSEEIIPAGEKKVWKDNRGFTIAELDSGGNLKLKGSVSKLR